MLIIFTEMYTFSINVTELGVCIITVSWSYPHEIGFLTWSMQILSLFPPVENHAVSLIPFKRKLTLYRSSLSTLCLLCIFITNSSSAMRHAKCFMVYYPQDSVFCVMGDFSLISSSWLSAIFFSFSFWTTLRISNIYALTYYDPSTGK